jgi:hypothetical protein
MVFFPECRYLQDLSLWTVFERVVTYNICPSGHSIENYARQLWQKRTWILFLNEWRMEFVNTILNTQCVNEHSRNIDLYLKDPIVAKHLSHLHDKYVFVPADKAVYNMFLSLQTRPYTICCCPCRQGPIQYRFCVLITLHRLLDKSIKN